MKKRRGKEALIVFPLLFLLPLAAAGEFQGMNTECIAISAPNGNAEDAVDITFVGDTGVSPDELQRVAKDFAFHIGTNLPTSHPFNEFKKKGILNIRAASITGGSADLSCCTSGVNPCNPAKVADLASACPTDEIIVLSPKFNELSCQKARILGTYGRHALLSPNPSAVDIVRELGKSMAFLGEERLYKGKPGIYGPLVADFEANQEFYKNQLQIFNFPNCAKENTCSKWSAVAGTRCIQECGLEEYFRDAENDVMQSGDTPSPLEILQMQNALNRYTQSGSVKEPMSIEINKPAEDFLIQQFLEINKEGHKGIIPAVNYDKITPPNVQKPDQEWWEGMMEIASAINPFCDNFLDFGGLSKFECTDIRVTDNTPAELKLTFTNIEREPKTDASDTVLTTFKIKTDISGRAKYRGSGSFDINCLAPPPIGTIEIHKDCEKDLPDIAWSTSFPVTVETEMKYAQTPNGVVKVEPKITKIIRPQDPGVRVQNKEAVSVDVAAGAPQDFLDFVIDTILAQEDAPAYAFATAEPEDCPPDQKCLATHLERNFDDIGLAFKYSTDTFGTGNYPNTHEPRNLFLDFSVSKVNENQPTAIEVESAGQDGGTQIRLSGQASLNLPMEIEKPTEGIRSCIKDIQHNVKQALTLSDADLRNFNRRINLDPAKYGSIKISQNYVDQHIANLWNRGHLCAESEIPITFFPSQIDPDTNPPLVSLKKVAYKLTPQKPYYISYEDTGDTNRDGSINFKDEVTSSGNFVLDIAFIFEGSDLSDTDDIVIDARLDQGFIAPLVLEEPDITQAFAEGFSFAQSFLKAADPEHIATSENDVQCLGTEAQCDILNNQFIGPAITAFIKESYTGPQISRGLAEAPVLPVRDVSLQLGEIIEYFNPGTPINLNFGTLFIK